MAIYRKVNQLSAVDVAYIAGLIDGEGTIGLTRKHVGENRQLVISISSTEQSILNYVRTTIGAGRITCKRVSRAHHRPGLTFTLSNRQALALLSQIQPYLKSYKRERGALVLENYLALTPRNGKYTAELRCARTTFEQRFMNLTTRIRKQKSTDGVPFPSP